MKNGQYYLLPLCKFLVDTWCMNLAYLYPDRIPSDMECMSFVWRQQMYRPGSALRVEIFKLIVTNFNRNVYLWQGALDNSQHLGTWLGSMLRTSPTLQVKPRVMVDWRALSGGHWLPMAEMFNSGSITALAYGTDRSNIRLSVEPQRSYNCGWRTAGMITRVKST